MSDSLRFKKKKNFLFVFDSFSPFYGKEGIVPIAFLKRDCERIVQVTPNKTATVSNSLQSLFTKELPWTICSRHSLQKSNLERFAQVAHYKRATGAIHSFSWANSSFAHKKRMNHLKNRWANSQPCQCVTCKDCGSIDSTLAQMLWEQWNAEVAHAQLHIAQWVVGGTLQIGQWW